MQRKMVIIMTYSVMTSKKVQADLGEWLTAMGVADKFNNQDLESGQTVATLLRAINSDCKVQLKEGGSALARVSNWNAITEELRKLGVAMSQEEKGKILNGNHDLIFKIISRLRQIQQRVSKETEINIRDFDPKRQVASAESLLQLFLLALVRHFSLTPKEALSLLSNDSKYLAHILAKGLKGDFRPVDALIGELFRSLPKILVFAKNKDNQSFFFRSVKPGLISKSEQVAEGSLQLLVEYLHSVDSKYRLILLREHLTATLMLVIKRHPQLVDRIVETALQIAEYSLDFVQEMIELSGKQDLNSLLLAVWAVYSRIQREDSFAKSSAFQKLTNHAAQSLKDTEQALSALTFFTQLSTTHFSLFASVGSEAVMEALRQTKFSKQNELLVLIHICCTLVGAAGEQKHPLAPLLFKLLTSKLVSTSGTQYETLCSNLVQVIAEIPTIPTLPILQMLSQRSDLKITQSELALFSQVLSSGAEERSAVAIFNMASRALVEEVGLGFQLATIIVNVVASFSQEEIIADMTGKLVKVCLALHFANTKKLGERRKPISHKTKLQGDQATTKLKILQIQVFLRKLVSLHQADLNSVIGPFICFSYIQIKNLNKDQNRSFEKGLESIMSLLGDISELVQKYSSQLTEKDPGHKQSNVKQQFSPQGRNQVDTSHLFSKETKRIKSSHPMSLSLAGVKNDAYLGIERYTKLHQNRVMAEERFRYELIKKEEDQRALKKVYEKKMIMERGLKIKSLSDQQLQYLFDFDSKEDFSQVNALNIPYYTPDAEEERDASGLDNMLRRYEKALRVYFTNYCGKKQGFTVKSFDEHQQRKGFIHPSSIFHFLTDHGLQNFITAKEVQTIARKINYKMGKIRDDPELLDFEGFRECIIQLAFTMYSRPPKDLRGHPVAEMLEELFSNLEVYAKENRISPQLFACPEASNYGGQEEAVKVLNIRLAENPDYILPEGYKKISESKISYDYRIYLDTMSLAYREVYEFVDQLLFATFHFHIIEPFTKQEKIITARPNIYHLDRQKLAESVQLKHIPVALKKEVAKFPIKDRMIAKEAATAIADIIQAVELNHQEVGVRHENAAIRSRKDQQDLQRRMRQVEERRRLNFDRQIKTTMGQYATRKESQKEKKEQEKEEEREKLKQEKERKERRDRQLKTKVEEYAQRKKEDQQAKKASQQSRIQKQREEGERRKREYEQTKRKIQEAKKQKQEEQKARKDQEAQEEKRKRQEERKKQEKAQREKKQMIEEFKARKKGDSKVIDQPIPSEQPQ